jgi:uncharacterized membrane protein
MYNDLLLDRIAHVPQDDADLRIQQLIDEIEELDNLLSPEARQLIFDLRPRTVSDDVYEDIDEKASFGDRMADKLANYAGSWRFIILMLMLLLGWMAINLALGPRAFDAAPFILLNLGLSTLAGLQAPVIMMAQNRQSAKDRAVADNDFQVNLKNELEIVDLHRKIDSLANTIEMQSRLMNALVTARRHELDATVRAITNGTLGR